MKKNRLFVLGLVTVFVALVSLTFVSSTWAKYTTQATGQDNARVAYWGFTGTDTEMEIGDLFKKVYDTTVNSNVDVIAPGTQGTDSFEFVYADANGLTKPEVAYTLTVSTSGSNCADDIKTNTSIKWYFDDELAGTNGTWDELIAEIEGLDGKAGAEGQEYQPNTLPAAFAAGTEHTIKWVWNFAGNDVTDTSMGNKSTLDTVKLVITITATQED